VLRKRERESERERGGTRESSQEGGKERKREREHAKKKERWRSRETERQRSTGKEVNLVTAQLRRGRSQQDGRALGIIAACRLERFTNCIYLDLYMYLYLYLLLYLNMYAFSYVHRISVCIYHDMGVRHKSVTNCINI